MRKRKQITFICKCGITLKDRPTCSACISTIVLREQVAKREHWGQSLRERAVDRAPRWRGNESHIIRRMDKQRRV